MNSKANNGAGMVFMATGLWFIALLGHGCRSEDVDVSRELGRAPALRPDYTNTVIPPNIAPLNFVVQGSGIEYAVKIYGKHGEPIRIRTATPTVTIPEKPWRQLLKRNQGGEFVIEVCEKNKGGKWLRYNRVTNRIAAGGIDRYLVYRFMKPLYNYWKHIGIYQRDLQTFDTSPVLRGWKTDPETPPSCVNCHTFLNNRPDQMTLGIRDGTYKSSVLITHGEDVTKVDTKFGYSSWHPSGKIVMYSINKVRQFFHESGTEVRDVVDLDSALQYYTIEGQAVKSNHTVAAPNRLESYPTWSPNGKYLYYSSAAIPWTDRDAMPPENFEEVRYSLMRVPYNIKTDRWGVVETVLSADQVGKSVLIPRISPDGRWLVFCMTDYGSFPIFQPSSDLYIIDLAQAKKDGRFTWRRLEINSDRSESWHGWSSNSRWLVFSSKRRDGVYTRTYFSYVDESGQAHKPFILPQEDPAYYDSLPKTFSVPELIAAPVRVDESALSAAVRSTQKVKVEMPLSGATARPGSSRNASPNMPERE